MILKNHSRDAAMTLKSSLRTACYDSSRPPMAKKIQGTAFIDVMLSAQHLALDYCEVLDPCCAKP